jgi:hypothetical protein
MDVWDRIGELIDRAERPVDLRWHRLHLIAARRLRAQGLPVPNEFRPDEVSSAVMSLAVPELLRRVRDSLDGPVALMKGAEVAALYPDPVLREFRDLDLLVEDAAGAWRALRAAGFEETGDAELYIDIHHLRPLYLPGYPLVIELHSEPKWVPWATPPSVPQLLAEAVPSGTGVDGILALAPAHHAVALAVHSWAHEPLRRIHELLDVALVEARASEEEAAAFAREHGVDRIWRTTLAARDAILADARPPVSLRVWARNLTRVRERTVLESHLEHLLAPFAAARPRTAARLALHELAADLRPAPGESWREKLGRSAQAVRDAATRRSEHRETVARRAEGEV